MIIRPEDITNIVGSPIANTRKYWPSIIETLNGTDSNKLAFQMAIISTIGVESGLFKPIDEFGGPVYFRRMYDIEGSRPEVARELGNLKPGDGIKYHGRGFIQLTGYYNYLAYGRALNIDLVNHPELANGQSESISILVKYMLDHGINVWANRAYRTDDDAVYPEEMCLTKIRRLVNGGLRHYEKFKGFWVKLKKLVEERK